jgi:hypothetical protein
MKLEFNFKWIYIISYYDWFTAPTKLELLETQIKRPLLRFQEYSLTNLLKEL